MERSLDNLMYSVYDKFLSPEEIELSIEGTDYWFDSSEVLARWNYKQGAATIHPYVPTTKKTKRKPIKE